jgi:hypothetical protein
MSMVRHVIYPPAKGLICNNFPLWKCETGGELRQLLLFMDFSSSKILLYFSDYVCCLQENVSR